MTKGKFPYAEVTRKCCIVLVKLLKPGKKKMTRFDDKAVLEISPVRAHRENSIFKSLPAGEYLIVPSVFKAGDVGRYTLEIHFPDVFTELDYSENNFWSKLKYTKVERLGKSSPCKILICYLI